MIGGTREGRVLVAEHWLLCMPWGSTPQMLTHSVIHQPSCGEFCLIPVWISQIPSCSVIILLPTCHMKELNLGGLACHEFELQLGVCLINLTHGQLDSVSEPGTGG